MSYYGRRSYRSWRSRGYGYTPSKYSILHNIFGAAVGEIRSAFLQLDEDALDELFSDYGSMHGDAAERYARATFPKWRSGGTNLSGQTMQRLVELVPPYLSPEQRYTVLLKVLEKHKPRAPSIAIKINVKEPAAGFTQLNEVLSKMSHDNILAHLPENVMKAASWLYDDDITVARAMLAEAERKENDTIRASAIKEIGLLQRTIQSGQVKSASYSVEMPTGRLSIVAYSPSLCFVATVCFGQAARQTMILRNWRDSVLMQKELGRCFIVWYYQNGERLANIVAGSKMLRISARFGIGAIVWVVSRCWKTREREHSDE